MGQIIKSFMSFCHSVCPSVNTPTAAILIRSWWNFAQWFGAQKVQEIWANAHETRESL